jgi:hypothetical protein
VINQFAVNEPVIPIDACILHWYLYVPATVIIYKKVEFEDVKSEFQVAAPVGTDVEVVVCVPPVQTNLIVSPTFAVTVFGENEVPPALTT